MFLNYRGSRLRRQFYQDLVALTLRVVIRVGCSIPFSENHFDKSDYGPLEILSIRLKCPMPQLTFFDSFHYCCKFQQGEYSSALTFQTAF